MYGAIKAQFVDAIDQTYNIDGRDITVHYLTVIDENARSMNDRYCNLKVDNEAYPKLGLNISKIKEFQGKIVQLDGIWSKEAKFKDKIMVEKPSWVFHVHTIKESTIEKKA